ncbi:MAG: pentapeptide repeat-containing protein [Elusimicrobia bacterium]|nr:pentapeptide repeat-containing protein [Elusimicrobiota bacterium]
MCKSKIPEIWPDLRNADLRWTNLRGADLRDTAIRGIKLTGAEYNRSTRLPFNDHVARQRGMKKD